MAIGTASFWIIAWAVTFTLPYLFTNAQLGAKVGYVYAGGNIIAFVFVWLVIGETRGRTLEEIDEMFARRLPSRLWKSYPKRSAVESPKEDLNAPNKAQ